MWKETTKRIVPALTLTQIAILKMTKSPTLTFTLRKGKLHKSILTIYDIYMYCSLQLSINTLKPSQPINQLWYISSILEHRIPISFCNFTSSSVLSVRSFTLLLIANQLFVLYYYRFLELVDLSLQNAFANGFNYVLFNLLLLYLQRVRDLMVAGSGYPVKNTRNGLDL